MSGYSTVWFQSFLWNLRHIRTYYTVLACCRQTKLCGNIYSRNAFHTMVMSAYCLGWHIIIFNILDNLWPLDFTEKNKKRNMSIYTVKHERETHIVYRAGKGKGKGMFSGGGKVGGWVGDEGKGSIPTGANTSPRPLMWSCSHTEFKYVIRN